MPKCLRCSTTITRKPTGRRRRYCSNRCRWAAFRKRAKRQRSKWATLFSSKTVEWSTPPDYFADLDQEFGPFDLDPCATPENAKCARFFTIKEDGLSQRWEGRVYVNPPYGRGCGLWMRKAWESAACGDAELVVCLIPSRTCTRWWHQYVSKAAEVRFVQGRLKFGGADAPAPFPSALVIYRPEGSAFCCADTPSGSATK
jgi:phage N-6-adenine-methyltransferase